MTNVSSFHQTPITSVSATVTGASQRKRQQTPRSTSVVEAAALRSFVLINVAPEPIKPLPDSKRHT
jgi:hypothetical protein